MASQTTSAQSVSSEDHHGQDAASTEHLSASDGDYDYESTFHSHYASTSSPPLGSPALSLRSPSSSQSETSGSDSSRSASPTPLSLPPPPLQHHLFAPPFYNRPPTPLPPSPSLTSLLRPSRPTTPDSSPDELASHLTGSPARPPGTPRRGSGPAHSSARHRGARVPTYEYYGFALYLFSTLAFLLYVLWSFLPSPFLHALGLHYYPNRWWSLALPAWLVVLVAYVYVALASYNVGYLTLGLGDVRGIVDAAGSVAVLGWESKHGDRDAHRHDARKGRRREKNLSRDRPLEIGGGRESHREKSRGGKEKRDRRDRSRRGHQRNVESVDVRQWKDVWSRGTDAVMDVPLGGVCEVLYGQGRDIWNE